VDTFSTHFYPNMQMGDVGGISEALMWATADLPETG
jgi:hypothetical protein